MTIQSLSVEDLIGVLNSAESKRAPEQLFVAGDTALLSAGKRVSVIGSRQVSEAGVARTQRLVKALVAHDIVVVSGLAQGVDTVAHETAIALGGKTVAVLGTSLDRVYPPGNEQLLARIASQHLAVSQFPNGSSPASKNFPIRNRTMALLSDATVIVEAAENSGTRHQGREALRLARPLFFMNAVADDPSLSWPNEMIRRGAQVLTEENLDSVLDSI